MFNPFKQKEIERLEAARKQEADYNMTLGLQQSQENMIDEQSILDRQAAMLQLSQWQQNRSPAMQRLFLNLAGCVYKKKENKLEYVPWNHGYVSILGARKLIDFIESLDHNVMLGSWSEKQIQLTLRDAIAHPLRRYIFFNHNEIKLDLNHAEYVFWVLMNCVEPTYYRGLNDGERRKDKEIIKVQEVRNPYYQQQKKKGIFGIEQT